jgi:hypothetical protein
MHYQRWYRHGDPRVVLRRSGQTTEERFWGYVDKTPTCWLWTGGKSHGYGTFSMSDREKDRQVMAHRMSYELVVGPIPDGMTLDHLCHTAAVTTCLDGPTCPHRACVRPDHLEPVPLPENIQRGGNGAKTRCKRGHPFDAENTYVSPKGGRFCRTCLRMHAALVRQRKRERRSENA